MRTLRTSEAADYLSVSPSTLRSWERRFGFPRPVRSPGQHRIYSLAELDALRDALAAGLGVSSAVSAARDTISSGGRTLAPALAGYRAADADRAMERALAVGTLEQAVTGLLLPVLQDVLRRRLDPPSPGACREPTGVERGAARRVGDPPLLAALGHGSVSRANHR